MGLVFFALGIVDAGIGHLLIAPRIKDETKRTVVKVSFTISGIGISVLGLLIYKGIIPL